MAAPVTAETRVPASEASVPTPEALFREAQAARTGGRLDEALALYRDLSRQFPDSREGQVALISLGQLALDRGAAADARAAFERYLARASGGALAEEALDGRASALAKLGLDELEAETWRELLRRFPRTVFRARAERRLAQLR